MKARVYLITNPLFAEFVGKIGISADPVKRATDLASAGYPRAFRVEGMSAPLPRAEALRQEVEIHRRFIRSNHAEGGGREWFRLDDEILGALGALEGWTWEVN